MFNLKIDVDGRQETVPVKAEDTILYVKLQIANKLCISPQQVTISLFGDTLKDEVILASKGIVSGMLGDLTFSHSSNLSFFSQIVAT